MNEATHRLVVTGGFTFAAEHFDTVLELSRNHAALSEQEPGCLHFEVLTPENGDLEIVFYEIFENRAAFELHRKAPHNEYWRSIAGPWIISRWARELVQHAPVEARAVPVAGN